MTTRTNGFGSKGFRSSTATPSFRNSMAGEALNDLATINNVKPMLLESKVAENDKFFRLSDGFKKIFANDKKDKKIVIPICGYGGHRRGDRS